MSWAEVEFGDCDLGDLRRTRRLIQVAEARSERPSASLPQGFESAAALKGAYEFCENGLIDQQWIYREAEQFGKRHQRRDRPLEEKESCKWLNSLEATAEVQAQCPSTRIVSVGDREADVYDLFLESLARRQDVLVRAAWNRRVLHPEKYLWEAVEAQAEAGRLELAVPRKGQQPARTAWLGIRHARITLLPPGWRAKEKLPNVPGFAVLAREESPPAGIPAIEWLLLTTVAVTDCAAACERIEWYTCRWAIELYHKVLKSGCRIEDRQFNAADHIERYLAIEAVVAWRVLGLTFQSREKPTLSCEAFLEPDEWRALYVFTKRSKTLPETVPTLKEAALWIAKLGGYLGRKSDGPPGITVMWRGLKRLADITLAWQILNHDDGQDI